MNRNRRSAPVPFPSMDFQREQVAPRSTMLPLALVLFLSCSLATAQSTLGELLDAGALKLSAEEFRQELVQRTLIGPSPTGGTLEIMYVANGQIQGVGSTRSTAVFVSSVFGGWQIDENGKVCTTMRIAATHPGAELTFPTRCQVWFKSDGQYFVSDSDWDRSAKVLRRTLKR